MHCTLKIDADIIGKEQPIAYKYVVLSEHWQDEYHYEFFHDAPKSSYGEFNRCLQVPSKISSDEGLLFLIIAWASP